MRSAFLMLPLALLPIAACDDTTTTPVAMTRPAVAQAQYGTIIDAQTVVAPGSNTDQVAGAVMGGIVGGLLGNQVGKGSGNALATAAGAAGGAYAGSQIVKNAPPRTTTRWTVRLANGQRFAVDQSANFAIGQQVRVVQTANGVRLEP